MQIDFEELAAVCSNQSGDECSVLAENEAASLMDDPDFPKQANECCEENCPLQDIARPKIVCLCGSTRFSAAFREANLRETLAGKIVLSIGCDFKSDDAIGLAEGDKKRLDELNKRKIDIADEILVLNVGGYIGNSTRSEIDYAAKPGKVIRYLEELPKVKDRG